MARIYGICCNLNFMFEDEDESVMVDAPVKFFSEDLAYKDVVDLVEDLNEQFNDPELINELVSKFIGENKEAEGKIKNLSIQPSMCYKNA